jgi:CO/xanthine dehydrogenase Mo-binding subunit
MDVEHSEAKVEDESAQDDVQKAELAAFRSSLAASAHLAATPMQFSATQGQLERAQFVVVFVRELAARLELDPVECRVELDTLRHLTLRYVFRPFV